MAWVTADTYTSGQILTAASLNKISGNLNDFGTAWTSYTPVFSQTGKTITSYTNQVGAYAQFGKLVIARVHITLNSVSGTGTGAHTITLPVNSSITSNFSQAGVLRNHIGSGIFLDSGTAVYPASWALNAQNTVTPVVTAGDGQNINVATGDQWSFTVIYESA